MADGVVAQTQGVEVSQHGQTPFIQASQIVVRQISGGGHKGGEGGRGKKDGSV